MLGYVEKLDLVVRGGIITELVPAPVTPIDWLVGVPSLINAHDHGRGSGTVRSGIADAPLEKWIPTLSAARASQEELVGDGCRAMLASGVGATVICVNPQTNDIATEVTKAAATALDCGIRAAIVYPLADAMGDDSRGLSGNGARDRESEAPAADRERQRSALSRRRPHQHIGAFA